MVLDEAEPADNLVIPGDMIESKEDGREPQQDLDAVDLKTEDRQYMVFAPRSPSYG